MQASTLTAAGDRLYAPACLACPFPYPYQVFHQTTQTRTLLARTATRVRETRQSCACLLRPACFPARTWKMGPGPRKTSERSLRRPGPGTGVGSSYYLPCLPRLLPCRNDRIVAVCRHPRARNTPRAQQNKRHVQYVSARHLKPNAYTANHSVNHRPLQSL